MMRPRANKIVLVAAYTLLGCTADTPPIETETATKNTKKSSFPLGVIERVTTELPKDVPDWGRVAVELIERDGLRYIVTTGFSRDIVDPVRSRQTAGAFARVRMGDILKEIVVKGATRTKVWQQEKRALSLVQIELKVPDDWQPGSSRTPKSEKQGEAKTCPCPKEQTAQRNSAQPPKAP